MTELIQAGYRHREFLKQERLRQLRQQQTDYDDEEDEDEENTLESEQVRSEREEKLYKWVNQTNRINKGLQAAAIQLTKESQNTVLGNYQLNSYAFHSRSLINTLMTVLPLGVDKRYVEKIFLDHGGTENDITHIHSDMTDKIRKRVLLSSNYSTAFKSKHVVEIFEELDAASDTLLLKLLKVKPSMPSI